MLPPVHPEGCVRRAGRGSLPVCHSSSTKGLSHGVEAAAKEGLIVEIRVVERDKLSRYGRFHRIPHKRLSTCYNALEW